MQQRVFRATALLAAIAGLVGCGGNGIPLVKHFEPASQYEVRSAQHWSLISADATDRTIEALEAAGVHQGTPIYVATPDSAGPFDYAFRDLLTTDLVQRGAAVQLHPVPGQYTVVYHAQVVKHPSVYSARYAREGDYGYYVGEGVTVRRGLHNTQALPAPVTAGGTYAGNHAYATGTEVILTTAVVHQDRFVSRTTDVYYLKNVDAALFQSSFTNVNLKVVSQ